MFLQIRATKSIGITILALILFASVVFASQRANNLNKLTPPPLPKIEGTKMVGNQRPDYCVALPVQENDSFTPTTTPNKFAERNNKIDQTVTPVPYKNVIDLDPLDTDEDKYQITVFRCNGDFDLFLVGMDRDFDESFYLEEGDIIINSIPPLSLMGKQPPEPERITTNSPTPKLITPVPYPVPGDELNERSVATGYP